MLHLALCLMLAAEPSSHSNGVPATEGAPVEEIAPAPRWPAALFFTGGGVTLWAGIGTFLVLLMGRTACCPAGFSARDDSREQAVEAGVISAGALSLLAGIVWLVWVRTQTVTDS